MSIDALPTISEECPGVTVSRRSPFSVLPALVRDPLQALPPEIYHEPVVYSQVAGRRRILLADPALIHEALVRNADALNKGEDVRRALGPALGQGLLTADGAHWRWQRQSVARRRPGIAGWHPDLPSASVTR
jgi:cytochrome P450